MFILSNCRCSISLGALSDVRLLPAPVSRRLLVLFDNRLLIWSPIMEAEKKSLRIRWKKRGSWRNTSIGTCHSISGVPTSSHRNLRPRTEENRRHASTGINAKSDPKSGHPLPRRRIRNVLLQWNRMLPVRTTVTPSGNRKLRSKVPSRLPNLHPKWLNIPLYPPPRHRNP